MCNRQSIATKIGKNDMNGMKLRVCDECFNSWTSRCKVSVIYEFPADRTNEKLLEASVVS